MTRTSGSHLEDLEADAWRAASRKWVIDTTRRTERRFVDGRVQWRRMRISDFLGRYDLMMRWPEAGVVVFVQVSSSPPSSHAMPGPMMPRGATPPIAVKDMMAMPTRADQDGYGYDGGYGSVLDVYARYSRRKGNRRCAAGHDTYSRRVGAVPCATCGAATTRYAGYVVERSWWGR